MIPSLCIDPLFPELSAAEKVRTVAEIGMRNIEFWGWREKNIDELARSCESNGVSVTNFSAHRRGSPIEPAEHETVLAELSDAQKVAGRLGCDTLMVLSNELGEGGRPVQPGTNRSTEERLEAMVALLQRACEMLERGMRLVIEPLNTRIDHPGNFLCSMDQAMEVVDRVGDERVTVLVDLYHLGVMGEELDRIIDERIDYIGYVHLADIPGRGEPGSGTEEWAPRLQRLTERGYDGVCGFEYMPSGDHAASVEACVSFWESLRR